MSQSERLVYRPAPGERHGLLAFLVFAMSPFLLAVPWQLAIVMLIGVWILTRP